MEEKAIKNKLLKKKKNLTCSKIFPEKYWCRSFSFALKRQSSNLANKIINIYEGKYWSNL